MASVVDRFLAFVPERKKNQCWVWSGGRNGKREPYGRFGVKVKRSVYAHRYAWELIHGSIPKGMCVLHKCDNPPCVNPDHLFLGTRADNNADRISKGRSADVKGELNANSKITTQDVFKIRELIVSGTSQVKIAKHLDIPLTTVNNIASRRSWTHI